MHHAKHVLIGVLMVVAAVAPAIAGDPSAGHYIAAHPGLAVYLPLAVGLLNALRQYYTARP